MMGLFCLSKEDSHLITPSSLQRQGGAGEPPPSAWIVPACAPHIRSGPSQHDWLSSQLSLRPVQLQEWRACLALSCLFPVVAASSPRAERGLGSGAKGSDSGAGGPRSACETAPLSACRLPHSCPCPAWANSLQPPSTGCVGGHRKVHASCLCGPALLESILRPLPVPACYLPGRPPAGPVQEPLPPPPAPTNARQASASRLSGIY